MSAVHNKLVMDEKFSQHTQTNLRSKNTIAYLLIAIILTVIFLALSAPPVLANAEVDPVKQEDELIDPEPDEPEAEPTPALSGAEAEPEPGGSDVLAEENPPADDSTPPPDESIPPEGSDPPDSGETLPEEPAEIVNEDAAPDEAAAPDENPPDDESGEDILVLDPYFTRDGVLYHFQSSCGSAENCVESMTPIQASLDDIVLNGAPDDQILYLEPGTYAEMVTIEHLGENLTLQNAGADNCVFAGDLFVRDVSGMLIFNQISFLGQISLEDAAQVVLNGTDADEVYDVALVGEEAVNVVIDGQGGSDTYQVSMSGSEANKTVEINDQGTDDGVDTLEIAGDGYHETVFTPAAPDEGTVYLDGNLITYDGLEPLINPVPTDHIVFNLTGSDDAASIIADGAMLRLSGSTFEDTSFNVPSSSLTINGMDGNDSLTIAADMVMPGVDLS
ncbi:MAG: hypothetical protein JW750_10260, partial [Anaerolineaceae bacterium]|nr:hypothetical protein [Anaerolineaceae bacterium]